MILAGRPSVPARGPAPPSHGGGFGLGNIGQAVRQTAQAAGRETHQTAVAARQIAGRAVQRLPAAPAHSGVMFGRASSQSAHTSAMQAAGVSPQQKLARVIASMSMNATRDPFAPIGSSGLLATRPIAQLQYQSMFNQAFQNLQKAGLVPRGQREPPLSFPTRAAGAGGELSYETGSGQNAQIHISPLALYQAVGNGFTPMRGWARETAVHELAHAMQPPSVLANRGLREGGAQAFADAAAIPAGLGPIPENDTNYTNLVRAIRTAGPRWFMRNQFQYTPVAGNRPPR